MKNKVLSLILALLMAASSASAVLADEAIADVDVEETAVVEEVAEAGQYDKAIAFLANYGIFKGISADDLGADLDVNRYQMALFVGRISTGWVDDSKWEDGPENWSEFTDISEGAVADYWGALSYANQKGIIEGYGNGKFGPYDGITYQNALTMVVRTLGYTGLDWPWGYIQKAVELGLTDGITDVAYTDELTRGETAQIIYNAMFAKTKAGSTLGLENFGIEFGWEKVVITASDLNSFVSDEGASAKLESNNAYRAFKDTVKTDDRFVAFKLLNDDGSLGEDTYYMLGKDIGLADEVNVHDDEAVVGDAYYILFEKDEDSNLCEVVAYESLHTETLWNLGKTDDEGEDQEYAIQEYLKDNTLVSKYTDNAYVNVTKSTKPEVMVFAANGNMTEKYVDGNYIAIDLETGNILEPVRDKDGNIVYADDDKTIIKYDVAWYYNELLDRYYEIGYTVDDEVWGLNWMSDAEFEKTFKKNEIVKTKSYNGFNQAITSIATSAYASLELFDTNLDGTADRGIYESYRLGYFTASEGEWCGSCGKTLDTYKISDVGTLAKAYLAADIKDDAKLDDDGNVVKVNFENVVEGVVCDDRNDRAWFVEGFEPEVDEDGNYKAGYVVYGYDAETGAIKIVKNVNDGTDVDSYVNTGVVRAYNLKKGTITIGDTQYSIKDYDELEGSGFKYATTNWNTRAQYTGLLRDLFNQFVTYVIVDGELVHIEATGKTGSEVIIVDSYAGLSSDGYIVVNGWSSSDLTYDRFRIGSYNGWMQGDYYYYLTEEKAAESFSKGAIYAITSYDAGEDVYYVYLAGEFDGDEYVVDTEWVNNLDRTVTIKNTNEGYFEYIDSKATKPVSVKMKDTDKYIIIEKPVDGRPYAAVKVYEGKLGEDWEVTGNVINTTDANKRTYVIINATIEKGFIDTYKSGLVVLLSDKYISADYDGADAEDWYLLGASEFEVEVFNLYTGNEENVILKGTNVDLEVGHVYFTQDDVLVEDLGVLTMNGIIDAAFNAYADTDADTAEYLFGTFSLTPSNYKNLFEDVKDGKTQKEFIAGATSLRATFDLRNTFYYSLNAKLGHTKYRNTLDSVKIFGVDYTETKSGDYTIKSIKSLSKSAFAELVEDYADYAFDANWVYDIDGEDIVIYVSLIPADHIYTTITETESEAFVVEELTDAKIMGKVVYEEVRINGILDKYNILGVKYYFTGDATEGIHVKLAQEGYNFGLEGDHSEEGYVVTYSVDYTDDTKTDIISEIVWESIVTSQYDCEAADCDDECVLCSLVNGIYVKFNEKAVVDVDYDDAGNALVESFEIRTCIENDEAADELFWNKVTTVNVIDATSGLVVGIAYEGNDDTTRFDTLGFYYEDAILSREDILDIDDVHNHEVDNTDDEIKESIVNP